MIKSFQFPSFMNAIEFVNGVANVAEKLNHHPIIIITNNWRAVNDDVDAVTERDIELAGQIEKRQGSRIS
ncbi:MAG TPA: 4a-hydroxytetrahydrobiopterin dehydratase [Bacteroidia bacterium]|nr:4a-hydroxytetrahydrobiopterin dehydratase [Bacteroidia bacterium]